MLEILQKRRERLERTSLGLLSEEEEDHQRQKAARKKKKLTKQRDKVARNIFRSCCEPPMMVGHVHARYAEQLFKYAGLAEDPKSEDKDANSDEDLSSSEDENDDTELQSRYLTEQVSKFFTFVKEQEAKEQIQAASKIQFAFRKRLKLSNNPLSVASEDICTDAVECQEHPVGTSVQHVEDDYSDDDKDSVFSGDSVQKDPWWVQKAIVIRENDFVAWVSKQWEKHPDMQPKIPREKNSILKAPNKQQCKVIAKRVFLDHSSPPLLPDRVTTSSLKPILKKLGLRNGPKALKTALVVKC